MAQVDFLNYFSILFWFFILFIIYYLSNYSYILPSLYSILFTRFALFHLYLSKLKAKFNYFFKHKYNFIYFKSSIAFYILVVKSFIYAYN
jgi:hypothetical protein